MKWRSVDLARAGRSRLAAWIASTIYLDETITNQ